MSCCNGNLISGTANHDGLRRPWDRGSARLLATLGFPALTTTSSGFAWSQGRSDNHVSLESTLAQLRAIAAAAEVPVNADFEGGFAIAPDDAARQAIDESRTGVLLTGRSEGFIVGRPDLVETIRRLIAYAEAGAGCLYAPGLRTRTDILAVVQAVAPTPVNVLVGSDFTTVAELAELGVRRISVGGALARVAWTAFLQASWEIAEQGTFRGLSTAMPFVDLDKTFAEK